MIDRISPRRRPAGCPVLHQRWSDLLFLHWRCDPQLLRRIVPAGLDIDLHDGEAWVGLTPFSVSHMRPSFMPAVPGLSRMREINMRVYVHRDGIPGIWFPSLDADHLLAVWAARIAYRLCYHHARIQLTRDATALRFRVHREDGDAARAMFDAAWQPAECMFDALPGSLDFFLIERYVLYCGTADRLMRARIHHRPWPLRHASLLNLESTMLETQGLPAPTLAPLVHAQAQSFDVAVWPPSRV